MQHVCGHQHPLQVPEFQSSLEKYCTRQIPDHSTLWKDYLDVCYEETLNYIREDVGDAFIWVPVDEMTDVVGCFIANLVSKLDSDGPLN